MDSPFICGTPRVRDRIGELERGLQRGFRRASVLRRAVKKPGLSPQAKSELQSMLRIQLRLNQSRSNSLQTLQAARQKLDDAMRQVDGGKPIQVENVRIGDLLVESGTLYLVNQRRKGPSLKNRIMNLLSMIRAKALNQMRASHKHRAT